MNQKLVRNFLIGLLAVNLFGWIAFLAIQGKKNSIPGEETRPAVQVAKGDQAKAPAAPSAVKRETVEKEKANPSAADAKKKPAPRPKLRYCGFKTHSPSFSRPQIILGFSDHISSKNLEKFISCSPNVSFTVKKEDFYSWEPEHVQGACYEHLVIAGDFIPGKTYQVRISGNLKAGDVALAAEKTFEAKIPDRSPKVRFLSGAGRYLAPSGNLTLPFQAVNVTNITITAERILPQNLHQFMMRELRMYEEWYGGYLEANLEKLTVPAGKKSFPIQGASNEMVFVGCDLSNVIGKNARGAFFVRAEKDEESEVASKIVYVSDLALSAKQADDATYVLVSSLLTAQPLSNVVVSVVSDCNSVIGTASTDASGVVRIPTPKDCNAISVVAENRANGDASYLPLVQENRISDSSPGDGYVAGNKCEGFVYTDRGIYRPGETVFCESILRKRNLKAPDPFPVVFKLYGPMGTLLRSFPAMSDSMGAVHVSIPILEEYLLGSYRVEICTPDRSDDPMGEAFFLVESIVPPQIRVDFHDLPARFDGSSSNAMTASVSSSYLFGSPAAGLKTTLQVSFAQDCFSPPGWESYRFGVTDESTRPLPPQTLPEAFLDEDGKADFSFSLEALKAYTCPVRATLRATVLENGGRPRSEDAATIIDVHPWYLGLCGKDSYLPGSEAVVNWALVKPDGSLFTDDIPMKASLFLEEVDWVCGVNNKNELVWNRETRETPIFTDKAVPSGKGGKGRFSFVAPDPSWGSYYLVLSDKQGNRTEFPFEVRFFGNGSETDPAAFYPISLRADRKSYYPGETATVSIDAPFTGTLWLIIQNEEVLQSRVVPLTQKFAEIKVPIPETLAPGVKLSATVIRPVGPEEIWAPHRSSGMVFLPIRPRRNLLDVAIDAPSQVLPSSRLPVTVSVTNRASGPVTEGAVTILAVDEALCMLTDFMTPSPVDFFFRRRRGDIFHYDFFSSLMQVTDESLLGFHSHVGGDQLVKGPKVRVNPIKTRRFKPVSLLRADVPVRNGKASFVFDIPEFSGQLRLMAIARTKEAVGSAEGKTLVRRKIVVQPDMARCLAPGDRSELTVSLNNLTSKDEPVSVSVRSEGPLEIITPPKSLTLAARSSRTLTIPVRAFDSVGPAKVVLRISGCGEKYEQTIDLPIRPATAWETSNSSYTIQPKKSVLFEASEGMLPETVEQKLEIMAFPVADIRSAVDYLVGYPFGCLEQTVSRGYPFLELARLPRGVMPDSKEYDAETRVKAAVFRLSLMYRGLSGFSMWPDYLPVDRSRSFYAIQFLAEAMNAGYDTGGFDRKGLLLMLDRFGNANLDDITQSLLCYALLGEPRLDRMSSLKELNKLGCAQLARLAEAYFLAGDPAVGRSLLERAGRPTSLEDATLLLKAWTKIDPMSPHCAECIDRINREKLSYCGHWGTTKSNSDVARAGLAFLSATGGVAGDQKVHCKVQFDVNGKKDMVVFPGKDDHYSLTKKGNGSVLVYNTGTNNLCVRRSVTAVPLATNRPPVQSQMAVFRNYYTTGGDALDLSKVKRGDNIVVELIVIPADDTKDIIIEDLLPACLEVERENIAAINTFPWIQYDGPAVMHSEARDDRVLVFPSRVPKLKPFRWYYLARAVSAGEYVVPAVRASAMYKPEAFSRGREEKMTVSR